MKKALICLVGRTNVGKSALFNRITKKPIKNLVFDKDHVTRDYIESELKLDKCIVDLVDTGGIFCEKNHNPLQQKTKDIALVKIEQANLVLFVCDVKTGVLQQDVNILKELRKFGKEIVLVVNKVDNKVLESEAYQFLKLGTKDMFHVSAIHGLGIKDLLDFINHKFARAEQPVQKKTHSVAELPAIHELEEETGEELEIENELDELAEELDEEDCFDEEDDFDEELEELDSIEQEDESDEENAECIKKESNYSDKYLFKVAIIGKPNVGKSSLLNGLSQNERSMVSEIEGTTREAVKSEIRYNHQLIELIDTPGMRKQGRVNDPLEKMMVKTAMGSVRTSNIVILMLDGSKGTFCNQELKLLDYSLSQKKAVLVVLNKTDLMTENSKLLFEGMIKRYKFLFSKVPVVRISCLNKEGFGKVRSKLDEIWQRSTTMISTAAATRIVQTYLQHRPLYKQTQLLKVFKVRALKALVPTFQLYVSEPRFFTECELNCIEKVLRKNFDFKGWPIVLRPIKA